MRIKQLAPGWACKESLQSGGRILCLSLMLVLLVGCKAAIYTKMTEVDANETLYTLLQGGIDAEKRPDPDGGFSVWTDKDDMAAAIGLLKANAQPEQKHPSLGELFGRNQLISTPAEERIRFVYGTEQALAQTLSKIDGVLVARVHIVLPINDPLANDVKPSSASVFIKHRAGQDLASSVPAIKDLVVRGIEGLSVERVAVTLFPASNTKAPAADSDALNAARNSGKFLGVAVPGSSVSGLWLRVVMMAALIAFALLFVSRMFRGADKPRPVMSSGPRTLQPPQG
jgi:type III secretion protein J